LKQTQARCGGLRRAESRDDEVDRDGVTLSKEIKWTSSEGVWQKSPLCSQADIVGTVGGDLELKERRDGSAHCPERALQSQGWERK
jgi:hypothetical protein